VPDSFMPLTGQSGLPGPDPALYSPLVLMTAGERMSTSDVVRSDAATPDEHDPVPHATRTPDGARAADVAAGLGFPDLPRL